MNAFASAIAAALAIGIGIGVGDDEWYFLLMYLHRSLDEGWQVLGCRE